MRSFIGAIWRRTPWRASIMRSVGLIPYWMKGPVMTEALWGFLRHASIDGDELMRTNLGIRRGPIVSVPLSVGCEYVLGSPESMHGEKPTLELAHLLMARSQSFLDVGSFLGYFIWFLKGAIGQKPCVAIEPDSTFSALLSANLAATGMNNVKVYEVAATAESATTRFYANLDNPSMSSVVPGFAGDARRAEADVRTERLDHLISESNLDEILVKMDVEGAEISAVSGLVGARGKVRFLIVELLDRSLADGAVKVIGDLLDMKGVQIRDYELLEFSDASSESAGRNWLFHRLDDSGLRDLVKEWRAHR